MIPPEEPPEDANTEILTGNVARSGSASGSASAEAGAGGAGVILPLFILLAAVVAIRDPAMAGALKKFFRKMSASHSTGTSPDGAEKRHPRGSAIGKIRFRIIE